jgi:hypothetical protein
MEDLEGAIACYRLAVASDPRYASAHNNLGAALYGRGDLDEAMRCFRAALAINPDYAKAHYNLGNVLLRKGDAETACACYRKALAGNPCYPEAHDNLGHALLHLGRFTEARAAFVKAREQFPPNHPRRAALARLRRQCDQLIALDARLAAVLRGEGKAGSAAETARLAWLAQQPYRRLYAASARLYGQAFAADAKLAEDRQAGHRYNAAGAAALAGCGQGKDAPKKAVERARLRRQALDWLRAELAAWERQLEQDGAALDVRRRLHWRSDPDLAGVRGQALDDLPEAERIAWQTLWAGVARTIARATTPNASAKRR